MLHSNVSKDRGFTLIESLTVVAIAGILMAMALPSFLAAHNRAKLAQATELVVATLQEAQRTSMRRNQSCTLTLDKDHHKIQGLSGCLLSEDRYLPNPVTLNYTGTTPRIEYGIRGNTTTNKAIILAIPDNPNESRCLTVSAPLGIIRLGSHNHQTNTCDRLDS